MAKKKGQGAMEYLMTYGWAIIIVVIVGVALAAIGLFSPARPAGCTPNEIGGTFTYNDHDLKADETFAVRLTTNKDVVVTEITVNGNAAGLTDVTMNGGSTSTLTTTAISGLTNRNTGDPYAFEVNVGYDVTGGIANKTATFTSCSGAVS